jgi:hypothetical protein
MRMRPKALFHPLRVDGKRSPAGSYLIPIKLEKNQRILMGLRVEPKICIF